MIMTALERRGNSPSEAKAYRKFSLALGDVKVSGVGLNLLFRSLADVGTDLIINGGC